MNDGKHRLKFDSGGRCRIYKDADRTEEVFTEDTEFPADTDTTVYLQGLKKSDDLGGETVTLQVGLDDQWTDTDSVDFTVVQSEFPVVVRAFIPYLWSEPEQPASFLDLVLGVLHTVIAEGDRRNVLFKEDSNRVSFRARQRVVITPYKDLHGSFDRIGQREANVAEISKHHVKQRSVPLVDLLKNMETAGAKMARISMKMVHQKLYRNAIYLLLCRQDRRHGHKRFF